jgi:hypothetical protein
MICLSGSGSADVTFIPPHLPAPFDVLAGRIKPTGRTYFSGAPTKHNRAMNFWMLIVPY